MKFERNSKNLIVVFVACWIFLWYVRFAQRRTEYSAQINCLMTSIFLMDVQSILSNICALFSAEPKDPPQHIRVLMSSSDKRPDTVGLVQIDPSDSGGLASDGGKTYPVRVIWDSPSQSNGPILAYMIYLTANRKQAVSRWFERTVDGSLRRIEIRGLDVNRVYYMQIAARNRHGRSPLSSVVAFRTPDGKWECATLV